MIFLRFVIANVSVPPPPSLLIATSDPSEAISLLCLDCFVAEFILSTSASLSVNSVKGLLAKTFLCRHSEPCPEQSRRRSEESQSDCFRTPSITMTKYAANCYAQYYNSSSVTRNEFTVFLVYIERKWFTKLTEVNTYMGKRNLASLLVECNFYPSS